MNRKNLIGRLIVMLPLVSMTTTAAVAAERIPEKWKSVSPRGLIGEAERLRSEGLFERENYKLLMQYVGRRYAAASASGKLEIKDWMPVASALSQELPDRTRRAMGKEIKSELAPDRSTIAELSFRECKSLAHLLDRLGSKEGAGVIDTWLAQNDVWPKWELKDLFALISDLHGLGPVSKDARNRVIRHIEAKYLSDVKAMRGVSLKGWQGIAGNLSNDLTPRARAVWAGKLYSAFSGSDVLAKFTLQNCRTLAGILGQLGSKQARAVLPAWVTQSDAWRSFEPGAICTLADELSGLGKPGKVARGRLIGHIEARLLSDSKSARAVRIGQWHAIVERFGKELSKEARAAWANKLYSAFTSDAKFLAKLNSQDCWAIVNLLSQLGSRQGRSVLAAWMNQTDSWKSLGLSSIGRLAGDLGKRGASRNGRALLLAHLESKYTGDSKTVADLSSNDCRFLVETLRRLGSRELAAVLPVWVKQSNEWQSFELGDMCGLGGELSRLGQPGKAARALLISHIEARHLGDSNSVRVVSPGEWHTIVGQFSRDLSRKARAAWTDKLYSAFTSDAKFLARLSESDRGAIVWVLDQLGCKPGSAVLVAWVDKTNAWQALDLQAIGRLTKVLGERGAGRQARTRLLRYLEAKYADDADVIAKLDSDDYRDLSEAFLELGSKRVSGLLAAWVTKGKAWQSLEPHGLADLGWRLSGIGDRGKDGIALVIGHIETKYLASDEAVISVSCNEWWDLAIRFGKALPGDSRNVWAGKLRSAYVDNAARLGGLESKEVMDLSKALTLLGDKNSSEVVTKWLSSR